MKSFEESTKPKAYSDAAALIMALLREPHEVSSDLPSKCISPSSLNCQVFNVWKVRGTPITPQKESFASRSFADAGTDRHARIQEFLSKTEYWVDVAEYIKEKGLDDDLEVVERAGYEVLLYSKKYNARFRLDGMLKIDGVYYVLEIKTERQAANTFRKAAEPKHVKQGLFYACALHVRGIVWLYEGRDFLEQKCFLQPVPESDIEAIDKYVSDIMRFKDEPYMLERNLKDCAGCAYKNYCKMYFNEYQKKLFLEKGGKK